MKYIKLSIKSLAAESRELAEDIGKTYQPDLVIYIARGGYLIGEEMAVYFQVPLVGIHAEREGGGLKDKVAPILRLLPSWLTKILREMELSSGVHKVKTERHVYWDEADFKRVKKQGITNILLVDDSVDTGYSMAQVKNKVQEDFGDVVTVKTAAINVWTKSEAICPTDYRSYTDTIIATPMSKDSQEYPDFERMYDHRNDN